MLSEDGLRIAVPSKGRLREDALSLLQRAGLRFRVAGRRLFSLCSLTGTRIVFCNVPDIPVLVAEGVADLGITGSDQVQERLPADVHVVEHRRLGFGRCHLSVAVHQDAPHQDPADLAGKVVGSSFPYLARGWFAEQGIEDVRVIEIRGALEVMVLLSMVDAIVEIVQTGQSLVEHDLVEIAEVGRAEAVLIGHPQPRDPEARDRLLRRLDGVLAASRYSLLSYNCPAEHLEEASRITPGFSSPTIQPLQDERWLAVNVMVEKDDIQQVIDALEKLGCRAILETELRHARL